MNISTLAFAGSDHTLGLTLVQNEILARWPDALILPATPLVAKDADYLLVSLYWWRDVYNFVRWLNDAGIDPRKRKPTIIIGGMQTLNPRPIMPYFHYAVVGDGEPVIVPLLEAIESGDDPTGMPGIWHDGEVIPGYLPQLNPQAHVDQRTNKTTRIELARGCKQKCPFCELAFIKPYRESPFEVVQTLIRRSPTKSIALFAPDMWSHSRAKEINDVCRKNGKNNTAQDTRIDFIERVAHASTIRFGIEAFGEEARRYIGKVGDNERLFQKMKYAFTELTTPKGNLIGMATCYVIGNFPGETAKNIEEFCDVLASVNSSLQHRVTLFLSVSSFAPSPLTPMWRCAIDPWTTLYDDYKGIMERTKPLRERLVLAHRGGIIGPGPRLAQMITIRGDERLSRVVFWLATQANKLLKERGNAAARQIMSACKQVGFDPEILWSERPLDEIPPWGNIRSHDDAWKAHEWRRGKPKADLEAGPISE